MSANSGGPPKKTGLFITFEGVEGAGKSMQVSALHARLVGQSYYPVFSTREPGGEPVAESIRQIVLQQDYPVDAMSELLLFIAARSQVTSRIIRPQLENGAIVLCDRYIDSTVAYQGYARGQDIETIRLLNRLATGGLMPDVTILLDVDPAAGLARQKDRNRMENESLEFHERVRNGYLAEARRDPVRIRVVDASQPPELVFQHVIEAVKPFLPGGQP